MFAKRNAEKCCPTDIRQTVPWCAGEDAIFKCPCEPDSSFFGHKPTCWGVWPASGSDWRDIHCGGLQQQEVVSEFANPNPKPIMLPEVESIDNGSQGNALLFADPVIGEVEPMPRPDLAPVQPATPVPTESN